MAINQSSLTLLYDKYQSIASESPGGVLAVGVMAMAMVMALVMVTVREILVGGVGGFGWWVWMVAL
jgi:hypothetical protein